MKRLISDKIEEILIPLIPLRTFESQFSEIDVKGRGANNTFQKYIIVAHHRSGSTMLMNALDQHPNIKSHGELFLPTSTSITSLESENNKIHILRLRNKYPIKFLTQLIFPSMSVNIHAVGFNLFPRQFENNRFRHLWHHFQMVKDIKIIFLRRKNLLASFVSLQHAKKTGKYSITNQSERVNFTFKLNYKKCLNFFQDTEMYINHAKDHLRNLDFFEITYEDMTKDFDNSINEIQQFLGVVPVSLSPKTIKKETRPLPEVISNYEYLRQKFINTKWETFFD